MAQLRGNMEAGLGDRVAKLQQHLQQLTVDPGSARQGLRAEAHKLRGIAGTHGHAKLSEIAGALEQAAALGEPASLEGLLKELVEFVQTIPVAAAKGEASPAPPPPPARAQAVRRVLAIDDDQETLKLLELTLRQLGRYEVVLASSGAEALACLQRETFDLVLCDAMMPDMNGLSLCERVHGDTSGRPRPPIVILSAASASELGWNIDVPFAPVGWWRKPFRPKALLADVQAHFAARG